MDPTWLKSLLQEDKAWSTSWPNSASVATTICIDLDLKGQQSPTYTPVSADPNSIIKDPVPDTAHVFLCASSTVAESIFNARQDTVSAAYVKSTNDHVTNFQISSREFSGTQTFVPYDPRILSTWLTLQPCQSCTLLLSGHFALSDDATVVPALLRSQVRLSRGANNSYTAVWFDFRDNSARFLESVERMGGYGKPLQRLFLQYPGRCLSNRILCPADFPVHLLLDILEVDLGALEPLALREPSMQPIELLAPAVKSLLDNSFKGFELLQSIIERAQILHMFVAQMINEITVKQINDSMAPSYLEALSSMQVSSSLMVSSLKRREEIAEKRMKLHDLVMQREQASNTAALTYCAAFFLPLSLSGTFLGMSSRAKDLHLIAFDFLAMALMFCTPAVVVYQGSLLLSSRRLIKWASRWVQPKRSSLFLNPNSGFALYTWFAVSASFSLGMLYDIRVGLILLGFATAMMLGGGLVYTLLEIFVWSSILRLLRWRRE
jgi:hypothetical protein